MKSLLKFSMIAILALGLAACGSTGSSGDKDTVGGKDTHYAFDNNPGEDTNNPGDDTNNPGDDTNNPGEDISGDTGGCVPDCSGKECGGNGCGGNCGLCGEDQTCNGGLCEDDVPEEMDCGGLLICYSNCDPEDTDEVLQACYEACYNSAPEAVKALDDALNGCMASNGWNDCANNECRDEILSVLCKDEYDACVPPGSKTCKEINTCVNDCPAETFNECATGCISDGSTEGQDQYNTFADCAIGNGFNDCATAQCQNDVVLDFCADEYDTCNELTGTCKDLWDCRQACAEDDDACLGACDSDTNIKGITDFNAFIDCIIETCDNPPTQECFDGAKASGGACFALYSACFNIM